MASEIIDNNEPQRHLVSLDELPKGALSGILRKLNEKSQRSTRFYNGQYKVTILDIKNLVEKIRQEFPDTVNISESLYLTLHLSSNQRHDFNSWEEIEGFDMTQKECTKSLSFIYTYNMAGADGNLESYRVQVSVQNISSKFGIYFGPISISRIEDAGIPPVPIHAAVDYKNYIRGKNILSTIDGWVDALPKQKKEITAFFEKYGDIVAEISQKFAVIFCVASIIPFIPQENSSIKDLGVFLSYSALWITISLFLSSFFSEKIRKLPRKFRSPSTIVFTKGDENYDDQVQGKNKTTFRLVCLSLFGVFVQVACGVSGNFVWEKVLGM